MALVDSLGLRVGGSAGQDDSVSVTGEMGVVHLHIFRGVVGSGVSSLEKDYWDDTIGFPWFLGGKGDLDLEVALVHGLMRAFFLQELYDR